MTNAVIALLSSRREWCLALAGADAVARHHAVEDAVEAPVAPAVGGRQPADLRPHDRRHSGPHHGHAVALPVGRRPERIGWIAGGWLLRDEAVAKRPGAAVHEDPRLALPAAA